MTDTHIYYRYTTLKLNIIFFTVNAMTILFKTNYFMHRCKILFVWSAVPVIKCFQKDKMSIFWSSSTCIWDGSGRCWWILSYQRRFLDVMQSEFVVRKLSRLDVIWTKRSSSGVSFCLPARSRAVSSQLSLHETIVYSVSIWSMNIKMNSNIIKVETRFRHANHSAFFVSGRLLRFKIPNLVDVCFPVTI